MVGALEREVGRQEDTGQSGQHAVDGKYQNLCPIHAHTGHPGSALVAADGKNGPSAGGVTGNTVDEQDNGDCHNQGQAHHTEGDLVPLHGAPRALGTDSGFCVMRRATDCHRDIKPREAMKEGTFSLT